MIELEQYNKPMSLYTHQLQGANPWLPLNLGGNMKWLRITILLTLFCVSCGWSKNHQIMMGMYVTAHAVDIMQTREILSDENYRELNPVLSGLNADQATGMMVGSGLMVYLLSENLPEYRTWIIAIPMSLALACVFNNWKIGVTF